MNRTDMDLNEIRPDRLRAALRIAADELRGTPTGPQHVILVAGHDYAGHGVDFAQVADARARLLTAADPARSSNASFIITVFDHSRGIIRRSTVDPGTGLRTWKVLDERGTFRAVTAADYSDHRFVGNARELLSIVHVYDLVEELGRRAPGSLIELSFFSHAFFDGPVLFNTFETVEPPLGTNARDPNDLDGRAARDFFPPITTPSLISAAFAPTGIIWTWGCSDIKAFSRVIVQTLNHPGLTPSDPDSTVISFAFTTQEATDFAATAKRYFGSDFYPGTRSFTRTLGEVKTFTKLGMERSYSGRIARSARRVCFGALPGTYATYDKEPPGRLLMQVPRAVPPFADDFTRLLSFYTRFLGVRLDPENRGYGEFSA